MILSGAAAGGVPGGSALGAVAMAGTSALGSTLVPMALDGGACGGSDGAT
jgi:hypothetical protein